MNKKLMALGLTAVLAVSMLAGCSAPAEEPQAEETQTEAPAENTEETTEETTEEEASEESSEEMAEEGMYEDGYYFAKEDEFSEKSGWKYTVMLEVKDGKIVTVDWNGVSKEAGVSKEEASKSGAYGMVENGGAQAPWFEQAEKAEAYLLETQDPTDIQYADDNYHTDAITGVSIGVSPMFTLAQKALEEGPKEMGPYKDGAYHAEEADFSEKSGWKSTVDITVLFGNIESVNWNAVHKDGGEGKKTVSMNGEYGMVENGGAQAPWHEQAAKAEAHLLATQDPTDIQYADDNYHTDAISGVSIGVSPLFTLAEEALSTAK